MKIGIISDIHLPNQGALPRPAQVADVMVLAGDIGMGLSGISWAKSVYTCPVVFVLGNHEYYNRVLERTDAELHNYVAGTHIHLLQNEQLVIGGVRFIGTTLWTDFALYSNPEAHMQAAGHVISDFAVIGYAGKHGLVGQNKNPYQECQLFTPADSVALHQKAVAYLEQALSAPFDGPTVVVTHHLPSARSVAPRFRGDVFTPAFASNLDDLVVNSKAALWIHGHGHDSMDYVLGDTRVIANPKGYRGEEKERESPPFRWDYTVELPTDESARE